MTFTTHVGLVVELVQGRNGEPHVVTITGERVKELYRGDSLDDAKEVYDNVVAHYGEREAAYKGVQGSEEAKQKAERDIEFKPVRKGGVKSRS